MKVNEFLRISFLIEYKFENERRNRSNNLVISLFLLELKKNVSLIVFLKSKTMMNLRRGGTTPRLCKFAA
jgi:hypothetical protein